MSDANARLAKRNALLAWTLRLTVLLQCAGYFAHAAHGETAIFEFLWLKAGLTEQTALAIANGGAWAVLFAAGLGLARRPRWLLYPVAGWFLATAIAETWLMGGRFFYTALPAHAVRIIAPAALVWLGTPGRARDLSVDHARRVLQWAAALTVLTHGWEAFHHHPRFADYIFATTDLFFDWRFDESTVLAILTVIGVVDIAVGLVIAAGQRVAGRAWRPVLVWIALWAGIAAFARMTHAGWAHYDDVLVRAANVGIPLALLWLSRSPDESTESTNLEPDDAH